MARPGRFVALLVVVASVGLAHAQGSAAEQPEQDDGDELPPLPHIDGPKLVDLGHGAEIAVPAGLVLYEETAAQTIMRDMGNDPEGTVAVILRRDAKWAIVIDADDMGYITDSDADELDPAQLLASFREGAVRQNAERKARGIPELFVDGWSQLPQYDRVRHRLVWGLDNHDVDGKVINFDTRLLSRSGYVAFGLIDSPDHIVAARQETLPILEAIRFKPGSRYEDHVGGDHDSGIGLRGLMLGGAGLMVAKKTGILVALLAFFKKAIIFIAAGLAGLFRWLFRRKRSAVEVRDEPPPAPPPDEPPPPPT